MNVIKRSSSTCDKEQLELRQAQLENERDLCIFSGSLKFLAQQLTNASGKSCPVCYRLYSNSSEGFGICRAQLEQKINETKESREMLKAQCKEKLATFDCPVGDRLEETQDKSKFVFDVQ